MYTHVPVVMTMIMTYVIVFDLHQAIYRHDTKMATKLGHEY